MKKITQLLNRNVEQILPSKEELEKKLLSGKKLAVKLGIDPTGPNIHIGRAVALWKLKEFQDLGHQVILIIGDFTALIGDPSDKDKRRPVLAQEKIKENIKFYKDQVGKILDIKKTEFRYNSEWLNKLGFKDIISLARLTTVNQMLARRNFADRFKREDPIGLDEFLYPLMQGYDSVAIKADVELGGTDQTFNLMMGRALQEHFHQAPQFVFITKMLDSLDGRKMSTSWGNTININDDPDNMFGKIMTLKDQSIINYFYLAAALADDEIKKWEEKLKSGLNPKEAKLKLASEVVKRYHGEERALKAQKNFEKVFSKKELPKNLQEVKIAPGSYPIIDLLIKVNLAPSKSEARRLIKQGAIDINKKTIKDVDAVIEAASGDIIKRGKYIFKKIIVS